MNEIQIREAQEKDALKLSELMKQLGYPISTEIILARIKLYQSNQAYFSYVAEINNCVIGSISVAIIDYFHREGRFARIVAMIVDEDYRKQGVGKQLIDRAEQAIKKYHCDFVELTSGMHREGLGSHNFYQKLGYIDAKDKKKYLVKLMR